MMKQISLATTGFELATKVTRKRELLAQMDAVTKLTGKYSKNPIKRAITRVMKKQAEISRNPLIYNNPEFEKPVKMVDFCRSREDRLASATVVSPCMISMTNAALRLAVQCLTSSSIFVLICVSFKDNI